DSLRNLYDSQHRLITGITGVLVVLAFWEFANLSVDNEFFFVGPWRVAEKTVDLFVGGSIYPHLKVSGIEFFLGYGIAAVIGIAFGMAFGISKVVREFLDPWLGGLYATPTVALAPLIIIWFGVDLTPKIVIVLVTAVVPIILNTYTGVLNVGREFQMLASAFCMPKYQTLFKILIPGSLPYIVTGLRLATSRAIVGIVVGEYFGSSHGIGFLLFKGFDTYNMPLMMTCAAILAGTGVVLNQGILIFEKRMAPWRDTSLQE
ncbi:MAG: ABC transporter permease, partial [Deltaproteobacteria bacterium]|nr:ABC transporter permease [Deltaproteobacteria bacterium]